MKKSLLLSCYLLICAVAQAQYMHDSLKVDNGYIHYYTRGEGEPIVLL